MSGAVLGGGSDALHQMVLVLTNFFEGAKGRVRGEAGKVKGEMGTGVEATMNWCARSSCNDG